MDIRKSTLSAAVAAFMMAGMAGQASAYTSAGSKIEYENLEINIGGLAAGQVDNFNFVTTNTTTLNGTTIADSDSCAGIPGVTNNCNAAPPRLNSDLQALGTTAHTENNFDLDGPNAGTQYSYSDSAIITAQLTGDAATSAGLIAETELLTTGGGNSLANIQSTTGFSFTFIVDDSGTLDLEFDANPEAYAASDNPGSILTIAESSVSMNFLLSQDKDAAGNDVSGNSAKWVPDGNDTNGCEIEGGSLSCSGEQDDETLNGKTGVTSDPASDFLSDNGNAFSHFEILVSGLASGEWTFTFTTTVANSVQKVKVPEPGIILLLGAGLAGFGVARRKIKKA